MYTNNGLDAEYIDTWGLRDGGWSTLVIVDTTRSYKKTNKPTEYLSKVQVIFFS